MSRWVFSEDFRIKKLEKDFHFHFFPLLLGPTDSLTGVVRVSVTIWLCSVVPCGSVNASLSSDHRWLQFVASQRLL